MYCRYNVISYILYKCMYFSSIFLDKSNNIFFSLSEAIYSSQLIEYNADVYPKLRWNSLYLITVLHTTLYHNATWTCNDYNMTGRSTSVIAFTSFVVIILQRIRNKRNSLYTDIWIKKFIVLPLPWCLRLALREILEDKCES